MALKRMALELGMGTDIRGTDYTKAAVRALRDALWHNSLTVTAALGVPLAQTQQIASVIEKNCVSCKLCEQVCIKDAVEVPRQHQFEDIGMSFMSYLTDEH